MRGGGGVFGVVEHSRILLRDTTLGTDVGSSIITCCGRTGGIHSKVVPTSGRKLLGLALLV